MTEFRAATRPATFLESETSTAHPSTLQLLETGFSCPFMALQTLMDMEEAEKISPSTFVMGKRTQEKMLSLHVRMPNTHM
jgi:hypothetical protein